MNGTATISIMADFGLGPYAWLRNPDEFPPLVGTNIADSVSGFSDGFHVSNELETEFAAWVTDFENNYEEIDFNWEDWNRRGIQLAKKLKSEIGDSFRVEYHYPFEDPRVLEN